MCRTFIYASSRARELLVSFAKEPYKRDYILAKETYDFKKPTNTHESMCRTFIFAPSRAREWVMSHTTDTRAHRHIRIRAVRAHERVIFVCICICTHLRINRFAKYVYTRSVIHTHTHTYAWTHTHIHTRTAHRHIFILGVRAHECVIWYTWMSHVTHNRHMSPWDPFIQSQRFVYTISAVFNMGWLQSVGSIKL